MELPSEQDLKRLEIENKNAEKWTGWMIRTGDRAEVVMLLTMLVVCIVIAAVLLLKQ